MGHYLKEICGFQCIDPGFRWAGYGTIKKIIKDMFGFHEYLGGDNLFEWPLCNERTGRGKAFMCQSGIAVSVHNGTAKNCTTYAESSMHSPHLGRSFPMQSTTRRSRPCSEPASL